MSRTSGVVETPITAVPNLVIMVEEMIFLEVNQGIETVVGTIAVEIVVIVAGMIGIIINKSLIAVPKDFRIRY